MANLNFEVRRKTAKGNGKVVLKGKGGKDAKSTLAMAREGLGKMVKNKKIREGVLRCAVLEGGTKRDEWNISAREKFAPKRKTKKMS